MKSSRFTEEQIIGVLKVASLKDGRNGGFPVAVPMKVTRTRDAKSRVATRSE